MVITSKNTISETSRITLTTYLGTVAQSNGYIIVTMIVTDHRKQTYFTLTHALTWLKHKSHRSFILPKCDMLLFLSSILFR